MAQLDTRQPRFAAADAIVIARTYFGVDATAQPLPSYADQNFLLATRDGRRYVLKVARPDETAATLDLQNAAMRHAAAGAPELAFPSPVAARDGSTIVAVPAADGGSCLTRLVTYVDAGLMADARPWDTPLLTSLGRALGQLSRALVTFDHPAMGRADLKWDLRNAHLIADCLPAIPDAAGRERVAGCLALYEREIAPGWDALPHGGVHHDANEHNILVSPPALDGRRVVGFIDFGDVLHSARVADLAVALAYAMMNRAAPLAAAATVVRGYHGFAPLSEAELGVLFPLIQLRLAMSVAFAARQRRLAPDNDYVSVSEAGAWRLLRQLEAVHPRFAAASFRAACGLPPAPAATTVIQWLERRRTEQTAVVDADLTRSVTLDLGVASPLLAEWPGEPDPRALAERIARDVAAAGATAAIGRYGEARLLYAGDAFTVPADELPERRTIHLGLDIFMPAGTAVYAPLDGVVHGVDDNAGRYDYGPTVILAHHPPELPAPFYTLYGHLSRDSLDALAPGQLIQRGHRLGAIGDLPENGGWPPHLHLQLMVDMLDRAGEFPGVAAPGERAVWRALCPDPHLLLGLEAAPEPVARPPAEIMAQRARYLGPSLSVAYRRRPLKIVRGRGQFLYDHVGRAYLDAVNNVAHVGHAHPRVVAAERAQAAVLNTNTRYLHDHIVTYAARLAATLPDPLGVCFLVCSGSEANDLALRLARAYTGRRDLLVVDGAYHGNLTSLVDISPYKFDGPGGSGAPDYVRVVPMPDPFRGRYRDVSEAGARYAAAAATVVADMVAAGRPPAAFIAESVLGCGGQVVLPDGYLAQTFSAVRAAGGVCIADEVQVGFGRVGSHFWGFETQGVVPDIVTLGKPIGNGHPLAAVVTTPAIAAAFANGMEYFNTFGGNPVSCAVGLAVLDIIAEEGLQARAGRVGAALLDGLRALQARHAVVGDVRGLGLFVGVELVADPARRTPAPDRATYAAYRLRDHGLLLSTDGPDHNVLKIKPPLVFDDGDAARLVETLDKVLAEDFMRPDALQASGSR